MSIHPDLQAEQAYIDRAYDRLEAMRRAAADLRDSVIGSGRGGTHQARVERDVFVQTSLQRLEQLQLGRSSLVFGRIDREPTDGYADGAVERFYIGRLAVSDEAQEPMVVDWRAPVAEAFYRATGRAPMGLRRRRHFATEGRELLAIEDEVFALGDGDAELVGPGALLAALQRSRSGQMRDIVATVQREQDEVIRAELPGILVVQGGPGTGKTAVALHRAAYLLYTYRFPLEQQGVLVIGPNQVFLRYIEQVLPSLGESGVALSTLTGLLPHVRPRTIDDAATARVKGDARMAQVISRAIGDRERALRRDLVIGFGSLSLRLPADATRGMVGAVRRRPGTHNGRRRQVETMLVRALHEHYLAAAARARRTFLGPEVVAEDGGDLGLAEFGDQIRHHPDVVAALDRMWPLLAPEDLLNDLFGSPPLLALAARGLLSDEERDALARPRATTLESVAWTAGDVPLIDEARALLGSMRVRRSRGGAVDEDEPRGYGHIVVDEAQDLSAMALRMLARRSISGSMTLAGDVGQATTAGASLAWSDVLRQLPARRPARIVSLTVNYRTPAEIMDTAAEVLAAATSDALVPPRSVRATGRAPDDRPVPTGSWADEVAAAAASLLGGGGNVAVIGARGALPRLAAALDAAGLPWGEAERSGLSAPITLLDVASAKGLEFDGVVVAEPAALVSEPGGGLRALFVALTRPTRELVLVHADPLPESLARGLERARSRPAEGLPPVLEGPPGSAGSGLAV